MMASKYTWRSTESFQSLIIFCSVFLTTSFLFYVVVSVLNFSLESNPSREFIELSLAPILLALSLLFSLAVKRFGIPVPRHQYVLLVFASVAVGLFAINSQPTVDYNVDFLPSINLGILAFLFLGLYFFLFLAYRTKEFWTKRPVKSMYFSLVVSLGISAILIGRLAFRDAKFLAWEIRHIEALTTISDYLAIAGGHVPYVSFLPQYQSLLALPVQFLASSDGISVEGIITYIVLLQISVVAALSLVIIFSLDFRWMWLGLFVLYSFLFLQGFMYLTIFDFLSVVPSRFLMIPLIGLGLMAMAKVERTQKASQTHLLFVGSLLLGGLGAATLINNLDFGAPAVASALLCVGVLSVKGKKFRTLFAFIVGLSTALVLALLLAHGLGDGFSIKSVFAFLVSFQQGSWWSLPMPAFGIHQFYLAFQLGASAYAMFQIFRKGLHKSLILFIALLYFASLGALSFVYFAGRSHLGVLTSLYLFFAVTAALWTVSVLKEIAAYRDQRLVSVTLSLPAFLISLSILSYTFGKPPDISGSVGYADIRSIDYWRQYGPGDLSVESQAVLSGLAIRGIEQRNVALLIDESSFLSATTGIPDLMVVSRVDYLSTVRGAADLQCHIWAERGTEFVLGAQPPSCVNSEESGLVGPLRLWRIDPESSRK